MWVWYRGNLVRATGLETLSMHCRDTQDSYRRRCPCPPPAVTFSESGIPIDHPQAIPAAVEMTLRGTEPNRDVLDELTPVVNLEASCNGSQILIIQAATHVL